MIKNILLTHESAIVKNNLQLRSLFGLVTKKEAIEAVDYIEKLGQEQYHRAKKKNQYFRFEDAVKRIDTIMDTKNGATLRTEKIAGKNKYYQVDLKDGKFRRTEFDENGRRTKTITNIHGDEITIEYETPKEKDVSIAPESTILNYCESCNSPSQNITIPDNGLAQLIQNTIIASI